ncbi:hypothetical protein WJX72_006931 [[Myrmecia] bisecta]|uniref:F-box domain-containing protein n=1 Tax=[Myrmecia] bisecta TaxID=41462 RepID=A0AAW1Q470_9CHLO
MGRRVSINDLPEELLVVVFDKVFSSREAFDERRVIVPLVCKRWAQLAVKPSPLWANCLGTARSLHQNASI